MTHLSTLWMRTLVIALGGALGGVGRYWISLLMTGPTRAVLFPWATLTVNLVGSFLLGLFLGGAAAGRFAVSDNLRAFVAVGFLGGLTTFSTFAYETVGPLQAGDLRRGLLNVALTFGLGLGACLAGILAGERF